MLSRTNAKTYNLKSEHFYLDEEGEKTKYNVDLLVDCIVCIITNIVSVWYGFSNLQGEWLSVVNHKK